MKGLFKYPSILNANRAIWLKRELRAPILPVKPEGKMKVVFNEREVTVKWLRRNNSRFPWIYVEKETRVAESEDHSYPFVLFNDNIIGFMKVAFNSVFIHDYNRILRIPIKNAFIYDTFVLPEHRGKHVGAFLLSEVMKYLKTCSYERVWCHIPPWNEASLRLYQNAGFDKASYIRFYKLMSLKFFSRYPEDVLFNS